MVETLMRVVCVSSKPMRFIVSGLEQHSKFSLCVLDVLRKYLGAGAWQCARVFFLLLPSGPPVHTCHLVHVFWARWLLQWPAYVALSLKCETKGTRRTPPPLYPEPHPPAKPDSNAPRFPFPIFHP